MALLILSALSLSAQNMQLRRVEVDSLVNYIRRVIDPNVFLVASEADHASFTVEGSKADFLKNAITELKAKGYIVSQYDGRTFITRSKGLAQELPAGFFEKGGSTQDNGELLKYINEQNEMATFQNKVYEIGEKTEGRTGKATITGYVRDISTGEPLTGVAVYDSRTNAYAQTDAYGFYRISYPLGEGVLNFSSYSMEDLHPRHKL